MNKEKLLISSCLVGENVRYDGNNNLIDALDILKKYFTFELICPEVQGGMTIPRDACEIVSQSPLKIINKQGNNTNKYFINGANIALEICKKLNIKYALLKSNSPSCSNEYIYDGSFNKTLIKGLGHTAKTLIDNNIKVFNEKQINKLIGEIK